MEQNTSTGYVEEITKQELNSNDEQLIETVEIEGTPFTAVRQGKEWFLVMGRYRLTEALETKEQALEEGKNESWFRIMQVMRVMMEAYDKEKKDLQTIAEGQKTNNTNQNDN